jgi:uncharacterized membrane protein
MTRTCVWVFCMGCSMAAHALSRLASHGGGNAVIVLLFILSWLIRLNAQANPSVIAYILSIVGGLLALVTVWLGGELMDRLGVGLDEGANLNARPELPLGATGY